MEPFQAILAIQQVRFQNREALHLQMPRAIKLKIIFVDVCRVVHSLSPQRYFQPQRHFPALLVGSSTLRQIPFFDEYGFKPWSLMRNSDSPP